MFASVTPNNAPDKLDPYCFFAFSDKLPGSGPA